MIMTLSSFLQDIVLQLLRDRFRFLGILNVVFVNYYYIMIEITCCPCKRLCCVCLMIYVKFSQPAHPLFTFSLFHFLSLYVNVLLTGFCKFLGWSFTRGGGYFHQNRTWMCLPDLENLTISI